MSCRILVCVREKFRRKPLGDMVIMMYRSKAAGMAVFIGMIMAGSLVQAAEGTVSTVDSQS